MATISIEFGTDGIRDVAGEGQLAPESVVRLGLALGDHLKERGAAGRPVLIGGDTRKSRESITGQLSSGLAVRGVEVIDVGILPTAALALLIDDYQAALSVVISASHNPAADNGIKIFSAGAEKLAENDAHWIERRWQELGASTLSQHFDSYRHDSRGQSLYLGHLLRNAPRVDLAGMRVALDMANGAAFEVGPRLFRECGAELVCIGTAPDGRNINEKCGALHPENLARLVVERRADLGLAVDGDADRSILVDAHGSIVDGDGVLAALGTDLKASGRLKDDTVVGTVMTNFGLEQFLRERGIRLERTPVGDRFVSARLREGALGLGGEPSGHVIFGADLHFLGDGLYTALRVAERMRRSREGLARLAEGFQRTPQVLLNVRVRQRPPLSQIQGYSEKVAHAEKRLGNAGRVLVRYSGTEPLVRVMVEGTQDQLIRSVAEDLAGFLEAQLC